MEEKIIPDYPTYSITNTGLVRDLRTGTLDNGHSHNGYRRINLTNIFGSKKYLIHRLVAESFIENPNNYQEVDHINRKPEDNRIENLRWANDFIQSQNRGEQNNISGHKHIVQGDGYYRVIITRDKKFIVKKRFKILEDAITYRNTMYKHFNL